MSRTKKTPQPPTRRLNLRDDTIGQVREWVHLSLDRPRRRQRVEQLLKQLPAHTRWDHLPYRLRHAFAKVEALAAQTVILDHLRLLTVEESARAKCAFGCNHRHAARLLGLAFHSVEGRRFFIRIKP